VLFFFFLLKEESATNVACIPINNLIDSINQMRRKHGLIPLFQMHEEIFQKEGYEHESYSYYAEVMSS